MAMSSETTNFSLLISPYLHARLAVILTMLGFLAAACFNLYGIRSTKRSIWTEIVLAAFASVFLGYGSLFIMLSCGLYV